MHSSLIFRLAGYALLLQQEAVQHDNWSSIEPSMTLVQWCWQDASRSGLGFPWSHRLKAKQFMLADDQYR